jgi:amidophosphoribosyltransferase
MDTGSRSQLLAANMSVEEIREYLNVDSLAYLTLDRLHTATGAVGAGFCDACLTGNYPVSVPVSLTRDALEVPVPTPASRTTESAFAGLLDGEATLPVDDARDRADDPPVTVVHDGRGGLGEDHLRA